jgi:DNA-binding transcriptional regulator YbjK
MAAASRSHEGELRRAEIIDAAIAVIAARGLEALSHRRVATAAGVPLGLTTYYFASLDELRSEALDEIVRRDLTAMEERWAAMPAERDVAVVLGTLIHDWLLDRVASVVTVEIFSSGLRRKSVGEIARAWQCAWIEALDPRVGPIRALASVTAAFGYIQYVLVAGEPPSREEAIAVMRQALGPAS